MMQLHVCDSLAIQQFIHGTRILDVGSGAGLPGIPLAIANPHLEVVLVDSNGKKTRFLSEVKRKLELSNVTIVQTRIEKYLSDANFDTIICRAFSDIKTFLELTHHCLKPCGIWLAMKGIIPHVELSSIQQAYTIYPYTLPAFQGLRCCIVIAN